ncbi:MAG TPA: MinD/ParA family protein [Solirubrobacteraceae bacterium]|nr:MinD/ParA family protein [Solirubrobacteraceae bacterium]
MNPIDHDSGEDQRREPDAQPDGPSLRRSAVYPHPVVDGRERREGAARGIRGSFRGMFSSRDGSQEVRLEARLAMPPALTRSNVIAVISPKGGVGKTTVTFLIGNLLASRLKVRAIAIDANPDFGTLATLAPEATASDHSLADLLAAMPRLASGAEVWPYVSRLPTGLHILAAPRRVELMEQITPSLYGDLLAFLGQYYEIVLLDLGTGITDPLSRFAVQRADQVAVVTTPEWITATSVSSALHYLDLTRPIVILNQAGASPTADWRAAARHFAGHRLARQVTIPYDEQLRTMLDSGTFTLDALRRPTRLPIKELGVEIAEQLV